MTDNTYSGAPDECSKCWPHKAHDGDVCFACGPYKTDKTYEDYLDALAATHVPKGHRRGQHAFNLLYAMHPDLANKVRGTNLDPFYKGEVIVPFFEYIQQHWEDL